MINDQKTLAIIPGDQHKEWLKEEFWEEIKKKMATKEYKSNSDKAKVAHIKASLRTGVSIPIAEHFRWMDDSIFQPEPGDNSGGGGSGGDGSAGSPPPPGLENCNGVYLSYDFVERSKEYPKLKNASAQAYSFKANVMVLNAMTEELKAWKMYIGFQHDEILVSASGTVLVDGNDFPAEVGNGTTLAGYPQTDLLDSIKTAGDMNQIRVQIAITGTQFGVKPPAIPMPKNIKLANEGFICPKDTRKESNMYVCCTKDKKKKKKKKDKDTDFLPRQNGDLNIAYDVLQAYGSNYMAQVTIDNINPLGRLDNWNVTWEWKRGEFIYSMKGAYTYKKDYSDCIYGEAGEYYQSLDFTQVMNCETNPVITDLPPEREKDNQIGNIPNCCKNGTILPPTMNSNLSQSIFQLQVYKLPPDTNRTALYPPQNWKINGFLNPQYKCGAPIRVSPTASPDTSGLMSESYAIASWQVVCNITRPKAKQSRCCVSFSAYYNMSVVPCNTCACGCPDDVTCNPNAQALLLPSNALLIPADNRTSLAREWAQLKHLNFPKRLPCPDYCGVSINWHIVSDYRKGWSARITLFNWDEYTFKDWFAAVQIPKAYKGYEKAYSFNGTMLTDPELNHTIFFNGLEGLNYLMPLDDDRKDRKNKPKVPGKQQTVISFTKKDTPNINVPEGDGFPTRVYFNGEECALPDHLPIGDAGFRAKPAILPLALLALMLLSLSSP